MISNKKVNYLIVFEIKNKYVLSINPVDHAIRGYPSIEQAMQNFASILKSYLNKDERENIYAERTILDVNPVIVEYNKPASILIQFVESLIVHKFPSSKIDIDGVYINPEAFNGCPTINVHKELLRIAGKTNPVDELMKSIPPRV